MAKLFFLLLASVPAFAAPGDSLLSARAAPLRFTTRASSLGFFSYGGRISSPNPALDFNLSCEKERWGFLVFKAFDVQDLHTDNNFAIALIHPNIRFGKHLLFAPNIGFVLDEHVHVAGQGSDAVVIINTTWKFNHHFSFEHSTRFSNLALATDEFDWLNRFRVMYTAGHFDLSLTAWHNNRVFDTSHYFSSGLNIGWMRTRINDHLSLNANVNGVLMIHTSDPEEFPKTNGVVVSVAVVMQ